MFKKNMNRNRTIFCSILIMFLIVLCYCFPYSGDDWAWGSSIGMERYNNFFKGYNGRYLGNIMVMLLTRSQLLKTLSMAGVLFGIIFLSYKYTNKKNTTLLFMASLCILALPRLILRQGIVWTSGFTNYAISIFLILIYIYVVKNIFEDEKPIYSNKIILPLLILGVCNALFVEHITLYSMALAVFVIGFTYMKFKKVYAAQIAYLIGAIAGTIIMFTNSAYSSIANSTDSYRSIPDSGIGGFIKTSINSYFNVIYKELFFNNVTLNLIIAVLAVIILYKFNRNSGIIKRITGNLIGMVIIGYSAYSILAKINPNWKVLLRYTNYFEGILSIIYYLAILLLIILFIEDKNKKAKMLFILISIACLTAPLFVVKPIGSRCFLATYVMFVLLINEFADYVMLDIKNNALVNCLNKIIITITILFAVYLLSIYSYVAKVNNERINYITAEAANNKKEIVLTKLPYEGYLWTATPTEDGLWEDRLKLFYNIPKDVDLKPISLKEWNKNFNK